MALLLLAAGACATPAPPPVAFTAEEAAMASRRGADAAAQITYDDAAYHTADGSRAYRYRWAAGPAGGAGGWLAIVVTADGHGRLMGSIPDTVVDLEPTALAAFERDAAATEFPDFRPVRDEGVCMDGRVNSFDMARGGRRGAAFSNQCGDFGEKVSRVAEDLRAMAKANGGISPLPRDLSAIPVKVISPRDLNP